MQFILQKNGPLPAHTQIKEQIKIALLLGNLRPGEILPSIRDLEKEFGISRNIVRRAYAEMEELGILKMIQGKGVMVNKNLRYREDKEFLENCSKLAASIKEQCDSMGVVFSSFARYLYHKAIEAEQEEPPFIYVDMSSQLAEERAEQIREILHVRIKGVSIVELKELQKRGAIRRGTKIICNYYRFDEVSKIFKGRGVEIVPLRMIFGQKTRNELGKVRPGSKILFLFDEEDQSTLSLILEDYRRAFEDQRLEFVSHPVKDIKSALQTEGVAKVLVSNRIWNSIPKEIRRAQHVSHPVMEFDPSSIEEVKMQLGVIA